MATRKENSNMENTNAANLPEQEVPLEPQIPSLVVRIYPARNLRNPQSKFRADASVNIGGVFAVNGFKIYDSAKGLFVRNPVQSYVKDGTQLQRDVFFPVTAEARAALNEQILKSYEITMEHENRQENAQAENVPDILEDDDLPFEMGEPDEGEGPSQGMSMG